MYCNHCGGELPAGGAFCPGCGRPVGGPVATQPRAAAPARGRLAKHLGILAVLWIAMSAMRLLGAGGIFAIRRVRFGMEPMWGHAPFMRDIFSFIGGILFLSAIAGFIVGIGLLQRRPWARMLALVLGAFALFDPPFGTALGIYTLWVLISSGGEEEYRNLARPA